MNLERPRAVTVGVRAIAGTYSTNSSSESKCAASKGLVITSWQWDYRTPIFGCAQIHQIADGYGICFRVVNLVGWVARLRAARVRPLENASLTVSRTQDDQNAGGGSGTVDPRPFRRGTA
jgi:hypothetical protein